MKLAHVPVGARLKDNHSGHSFLVGEHNHAQWPGTVLVCEKVIARAPLDLPKETYSDTESRKFGSNDYPASDLHRWLNDDKNGGFLEELSQELRSSLLLAEVPYCGRSGELETFQAKVFLLSLEEIGVDCPDHMAEGSRIALFREFRRRFSFPTPEVVAKAPAGYGVLNENDSWSYWLRSSHPAHSSVQYVCHAHSPYAMRAAYRSHIGVRPACCVDSNLEVVEQDGEYIICCLEANKSYGYS